MMDFYKDLLNSAEYWHNGNGMKQIFSWSWKSIDQLSDKWKSGIENLSFYTNFILFPEQFIQLFSQA